MRFKKARTLAFLVVTAVVWYASLDFFCSRTEIGQLYFKIKKEAQNTRKNGGIEEKPAKFNPEDDQIGQNNQNNQNDQSNENEKNNPKSQFQNTATTKIEPILPNQVNQKPKQSLLNTLVNTVTSLKNLIFNKPVNNFKLEPYESSILDEKWDKKNDPIVFLHIGKNGGTSFDSTVKPIVKGLSGKYVGDRHFDWTYVKSLENDKTPGKPKVVLLLRDPISRAISHFHFMQKLSWTKNSPVRAENITQYLKDYQTMLQTRDAWQDGQASVSWLSATHIAGWVVKGITLNEADKREVQALNYTNVLLTAAHNLRSSFWFGFLEDQERGFELLQHKLGYSKEIKMSVHNKHRVKPNVPTPGDIEFLRKLLPQDIWLYEYGQLLFEARWKHYKGEEYVDPEIPPLPEINCISTRFVLRCKDPHIYHVWVQSEEQAAHQRELLPDFGLDSGL